VAVGGFEIQRRRINRSEPSFVRCEPKPRVGVSSAFLWHHRSAKGRIDALLAKSPRWDGSDWDGSDWMALAEFGLAERALAES